MSIKVASSCYFPFSGSEFILKRLALTSKEVKRYENVLSSLSSSSSTDWPLLMLTKTGIDNLSLHQSVALSQKVTYVHFLNRSPLVFQETKSTMFNMGVLAFSLINIIGA